MSSGVYSGGTPTKIILNKSKDLLTVHFNNGDIGEFEAEFLRVYSPSAEVKGHGSEPRKIIPGKRDVKIMSLEPVGHYAIKPVFNDGHDTGIYSWVYLLELWESKDNLWGSYLDDLKQGGLSRN